MSPFVQSFLLADLEYLQHSFHPLPASINVVELLCDVVELPLAFSVLAFYMRLKAFHLAHYRRDLAGHLVFDGSVEQAKHSTEPELRNFLDGGGYG